MSLVVCPSAFVRCDHSSHFRVQVVRAWQRLNRVAAQYEVVQMRLLVWQEYACKLATILNRVTTIDTPLEELVDQSNEFVLCFPYILWVRSRSV